MSNVIVRKSNGDTLEVTLLTLFNMLADEDSHTAVLLRLNREKHPTVELKDGPAQIWRTMAPPPSQSVRLYQAPQCDFIADTLLHFALPAQIHCRAQSPEEAKELIRETIKGERGVGSGFMIDIQDDLELFYNNLEIGNLDQITDVTIDHVEQQHLLLLGTDVTP